MTSRSDMIAVLEAVLFVSNEPVTRERLLEVFEPRDRDEAGTALEAILERYQEEPERGVWIDEVAGGLRIVTRPDLHGYLRRFFEISGTNKLSMAALETLAIIAYRQPVTAPEIQELRGVSASGVVKTLLERRLIRIAGRKEVVGKPFLYATTREFLMHFGLKSLKELPPLEQFEELYGGEAESETLAGEDHEENVLREAAAIEEAEADLEADAEPVDPEPVELDDEVEDGADSAGAASAESVDEGAEAEQDAHQAGDMDTESGGTEDNVPSSDDQTDPETSESKAPTGEPVSAGAPMEARDE